MGNLGGEKENGTFCDLREVHGGHGWFGEMRHQERDYK